MKKHYLSIYFGHHDSNICFSTEEKILLHLEAERVYRKKHMRFEDSVSMEKFIASGLEYLSLSIDQIDQVFLGEWNNKFDIVDGKITILGHTFTPTITSHHQNHIGTSYPSGFDNAVIVCADGGSEDGTTKIYHRKDNKVTELKNLDSTIMTGKFYGTLTQMIITPRFGRAHDTEPGKTMGLAALGKENLELRQLIVDNAREINKLHMTGCEHLLEIFGLSQNYEKPWLDQRRCDLAFEGQNYWVNTFRDEINSFSSLSGNVCLVGGCALNVNLNSALIDAGKYKNVYISPVSSDCGQSIGAILFHHPEVKCSYPYLGREYGDLDEVPTQLVSDILDHKVVAWYQGRSESGPRALGHRSFIGLADTMEMKRKLSEDVKKREPYRPVAPIIAEEYLEDFFDTNCPSPFMTFSPSAKEITKKVAPAIIHFDGTSRIQTLKKEDNPILHQLLLEVMKQTGAPIIMNSSLNVMGEPIVDTPEDALKNFSNSGADILYINGIRYEK